jgi:hypothetical protein
MDSGDKFLVDLCKKREKDEKFEISSFNLLHFEIARLIK